MRNLRDPACRATPADLEAAIRAWRDPYARLAGVEKILVFGARQADLVLAELGARGLEPAGLLDQDPDLWGTRVGGLDVLPPKAAAGLATGSVGAAIWQPVSVEAALLLRGCGIRTVVELWNHYRPEHVGSRKFDPALYEGAFDRILAVCGRMADPASVDAYLRVILYRLMLDPLVLPFSDYPQYLHPATAPRTGDVIVDGGAYTGDTAVDFALRARGRCRVHAFEPENANFSRLRQAVARFGLEGIVDPVRLGLWDAPGCLSLEPGEGFSRIVGHSGHSGHSGQGGRYDLGVRPDSPDGAPDGSADGAAGGAPVGVGGGGQRIRVTDLDSWCAANRVRPTLVKLDLEGAEPRALAGAARTIAHHAPRQAVSIYHAPDHLWTLPLALAEMVPGYRFHCGHHNFGAPDSETVLYALT